LLETGKHAQRGCFAAATWTQEREELAGVNLKIDLVDGNDVAVALSYVIEFN